MKPLQIDCKWLSKSGEAPTEAEVDRMIRAIENHADSKGWIKFVSETQHWVTLLNADDMVFYIVRTYEI